MVRSLAKLVGFCMVGAVAAAGCGGSGGPSTFSVVYSTDWTNFAAANGGQSQRITIYDANDLVVGTTVMNEDVAGIEQFNFTAIPRGVDRFVIQLYSGKNLTGTQTGTLEAVVDVEKPTTLNTAVGVTPTQLKITPPSASLAVPQTTRFVATAYQTPSVAAFITPGDVTWQLTGSVGTLDATTGVFVSTAAGTGTVKATLGTPALVGTAPIVVAAENVQTTKWTVLVYINAANDLSPFALTNVNQLESVAQNPDVRFVLQWKQATGVSPSQVFNGTRRYLVKPDTSSALKSQLIQDLGDGVDMGRPETLRDFIAWAETHYPAQRYVLVVWNHGNGWRRSPADLAASRAVSYDDETGNAIQIWELKTALAGRHFEMIAWDASLMQMLEIAYEIRSFTTYVVGSEESPPGAGYPYDLVFGKFRDHPDQNSATLSQAFVYGMIADPNYKTEKITQSVLRTDKLGDLATAVSALADVLVSEQAGLSGVIPAVRAATQIYSPRSNPPRYYLDLYNLCQNLDSMVALPDVQNAALNVESAVRNAVLWEGHNSLSQGSHGVSIDFSPSADFTPSASIYGQMEFAQNTHWPNWLNIAP